MISYDVLSSEENPKQEPFPTSSLAILFEKETSTSTCLKNKDVSLAYKAPKQPKSLFNQDLSLQKKTPNTIVFCAKTIRLAQSTFDGENRFGIALIGNEHLHVYELILYKDKQNVFNRIKVNSTFIFNIDDKSASFNDESNDVLRVVFQSETDLHEFTEWVKRKGGQIVENVQKSDFNEFSFKLKDESEISTLINEEIPSNNGSALANIAKSMSNVIPERKLRSRLNNEPFNYLCSPNRTENRTQHNLLPLAHNSAASPFHDINYGTFAHSNTFMADNLNTFMADNVNTFMADNLNSFMAETRSQSCEMRMHMLQLSSKLDILLRDVKDISKTQNIIKENSRGSTDGAVNNLKQENDELRKQLDLVNEQNCRLKCDLHNKSADLNDTLVTIENISELKVKCDEMAIENCDSLKNEVDALSKTVKMQQQNIVELEMENAVIKKRQSGELEVPLVKESMNKLYRNLLNAFDDTTTYDMRQIEEAIARHLRCTSYELVRNVKMNQQ